MFIKRYRLFITLLFLIIAGGISQALAAEGGGSGGGVSSGNALIVFAAVVAVGISCMTSAYALAKIGAAAMGAMSEKPELGGRALVFLGMAEGIAIYGLIVAIMILNKV